MFSSFVQPIDLKDFDTFPFLAFSLRQKCICNGDLAAKIILIKAQFKLKQKHPKTYLPNLIDFKCIEGF